QRLDDEGRRLLQVIRTSGSKMGQLIDDLLAFSQVGRKVMSANRVHMRPLVEEAFQTVSAERHGATPTLMIGSLPDAWGDRALLFQVWINLISNAVKYSATREQPTVEIHGRIEDGQALYEVRDNGVGFDMRYYDKLFGVFQRLHSADEFSGTGVGLALVQRIVVRHGGRVWAESEPGAGASFYFLLPRGEMDDEGA
ncbi:MAG: histidine kinase, partial [Burkholderiales bacterium]|nr:histidine kinase [Burkholderiales bacterium]